MGIFDRDKGGQAPPDDVPAEVAPTPPTPPDAPAASLLQSPQDRAYMRVELLRVCHGHHLEANAIVERAKTLEAYVFGDQAADKP